MFQSLITPPHVDSGRSSVSLLVSIVLLFGASASPTLADNECGAGEAWESETTVTCDASNYDPEQDGNIVYLLARHPAAATENYKVNFVGLSGDKAIKLDDSLDQPHSYDTGKPSAIWISYGGNGDFTVDISDIELRTGLTDETGRSYRDPNDQSQGTADQRGVGVWLENVEANRQHYSKSRELTLNVRNSEFHTFSRAINAVNDWNGAINIDVRDTRIRTYGLNGHGIVGFHDAVGDVNVYAERVDIVTQDAFGIQGVIFASDKEAPNPFSGPATIKLTVKDSNLNVAGAFNAGLYGSHYGSGKVQISVQNSRVVATDGAWGVLVLHRDDATESDDLDISIDIIDSEIETADANGIYIYRGLNRSSTGTNRITVGSRVRAGGASSTAIVAQGNTELTLRGQISAESGNAIQIEDGDFILHLDGGRIDGLVTTGAGHTNEIRVGNKMFVRNGEVSSDTGHSGIYDISAAAAADGIMLNSQIAPRAAVYESLPGVLMRLDEIRNIETIRLQSPDKPTWMEVAVRYGSYKPNSATLDGRYKFRRYAGTAGKDFSLRDDLNGWIGARLVVGSAGISAPTGGGRIRTSGFGPVAGLTWEKGEGTYATGRVSLTWHHVDYSSLSQDNLKNGADALVHAIDLEAGRRVAVNEKTQLTYRTWVGRSGLSMNDFSDAVGSRVSLEDANQLAVGIGVGAETKKDISDGEKPILLHGLLGVEKQIEGNSTKVRVFEEELISKGPETRLLLGASANWKAEPFTLRGAISSTGLGSDDKAFTASLTLRMDF